MNNIAILDCTLRDGGYVNNWEFTEEQATATVNGLTCAEIDYIEAGYLTSITSDVGGTRFGDMESVMRCLPENRKKSMYVVMADVSQFDADTLCGRTAGTADGVRVVFYKRQIKQAYEFCEKLAVLGYALFLQPMVTMDYSPSEFGSLVSQFQKSYPLYSVAVVDSFGCMTEKEVNGCIQILDNLLPEDVKIGFHGHNNLNLAMQNALTFFKYQSNRRFIIDASVNGVGRGAGNLPTEQIASYCNAVYGAGYDLNPIIKIMSDVTEPLSRQHRWGYTPYFLLTGMYKAHPNFATFLLEKHEISISDFAEYLSCIPHNMLTRCTRPYVEELYAHYGSLQDSQ